jgi:integrase
MLDFLHDLRTRPSRETGQPIGESTVFNYFLKTMVFLNDRGIGKYMAREDWVQKKDWPVNVDKRNKNKKYATYTGQEVAAMIQVADSVEEALTRLLVGTGFRIGEAAVAEWLDINWRTRPSPFASNRNSASSPRTMKSGPSPSAIRCSPASRSIAAKRRMMR